MIPELRQAFNAHYQPQRYRRFLDLMHQRSGAEVKFRLCETPCFFPPDLLDRMAREGQELIHQLVGNPAYQAASDRSIPEEYRCPAEDPHPLFVQADFGLVRDAEGRLQPKLVEIQGFPSLYAFQPELARCYIEAYGLDPNLRYLLSGLDDTQYINRLRRAIVADSDPENTVLLEIDPQSQKTLPDFLLTEKQIGVRTVCITRVIRRERKLFYRRDDGVEVPIHRIYNRVIVDELERKQIAAPFTFRDDLDVRWAGHPNWFFRISKYSIPYLKHPSVPRTWFLHEVKDLPPDLENYVLKPLFSFAGIGVIVGPTAEEVAAVPAGVRQNYILQERMRFEPVIDTPHGLTQAEIRIMYVWDQEPEAVTTIIRMGRGKMMGVDHNRELEWVGASAALTPSS